MNTCISSFYSARGEVGKKEAQRCKKIDGAELKREEERNSAMRNYEICIAAFVRAKMRTTHVHARAHTYAPPSEKAEERDGAAI